MRAPCGDAEPAVDTRVEHHGLLFNICNLTTPFQDILVLNVLAYRAAAVLEVFMYLQTHLIDTQHTVHSVLGL